MKPRKPRVSRRNAAPAKLLGEVGAVGIDRLTQDQFIANGENDGVHGHILREMPNAECRMPNDNPVCTE